MIAAGWFLFAALLGNGLMPLFGYPGVDIDFGLSISLGILTCATLLPCVLFFLGFGLASRRRVLIHAVIALPVALVSLRILAGSLRHPADYLLTVVDEVPAGSSRLRAYWTHRGGSNGYYTFRQERLLPLGLIIDRNVVFEDFQDDFGDKLAVTGPDTFEVRENASPARRYTFHVAPSAFFPKLVASESAAEISR